MHIFAVAAGGFVGAICRFLIDIMLPETVFPYSTLSVNLIGCFLLGWFLSSGWVKERVSEAVKLGIGTGMIGAFTTFSTFSVDTLLVVKNENYLAILYIVLSVVLGLLFGKLGVVLGKTKHKKEEVSK
jgi:fluoride exporter